MDHIKELVSLTIAKIEILKLKADDYAWSCYVDDQTKQQLEDALLEINSLLSDIKIKPKKTTRSKSEIKPIQVIDSFNDFFKFEKVSRTIKPSSALEKRLRICINKEFKTIGEWVKYFELIKLSDFLMGKIPPSYGYTKQFKLNLDYIVNDTNIYKILERRV